MAKDTDIAETIDRVNEIIDRLESGEVSRDEGENLLTEGYEQISTLRDCIDSERGEIIELEN